MSLYSLFHGVALFVFVSFVIAVVFVRLEGDRGFGLLLRKRPFLFLTSPVALAFWLIRFVAKIILAVIQAVNSWFRALFEKATGRKTYRRMKTYSGYSYSRNRSD